MAVDIYIQEKRPIHLKRKETNTFEKRPIHLKT